MISVEDIITGEKIQLACDHFIGNSGCITNPRIHKEANHKFLKANTISNNFDNGSKVFCYTHTLGSNELVSILRKFKNPFTLYCHNSDHSFEEKHTTLVDSIPNLKFIYTQNMNVIHPKIQFLPIGVANSQWQHGNLDYWKQVLSQRPFQKTKDFYFNFNIRTNPKERQQCYDSLKNKLTWIKGTNYQSYLNALKDYKFCICPFGNGFDTHRVWECLYLEVVPIVIRGILNDRISEKLPIVILDSWDDFDGLKSLIDIKIFHGLIYI